MKTLFGKPCVIGLVADTDTGKSNYIYHVIDELQKDYSFDVYTYGLRLPFKGAKQIFSVAELETIKDSTIFVDEMMSLFDLDNRKVKKQIENTIRLVYHNNNVLFLCGLGENWKKFLSAKLNVIIYKKLTIQDLINGSTVKNNLIAYRGVERGTEILNLAIDEALIFDGKNYKKVHIPYMKKYDTKKANKDILTKKAKKTNKNILTKKK